MMYPSSDNDSALHSNRASAQNSSDWLYHKESGYYYQPSTGLYFNENTKVYYRFDSVTGAFTEYARSTQSNNSDTKSDGTTAEVTQQQHDQINDDGPRQFESGRQLVSYADLTSVPCGGLGALTNNNNSTIVDLTGDISNNNDDGDNNGHTSIDNSDYNDSNDSGDDGGQTSGGTSAHIEDSDTMSQASKSKNQKKNKKRRERHRAQKELAKELQREKERMKRSKKEKHENEFGPYVFEPETGLYRDPATGSYYDTASGFYYDNVSGIYYYYDHETNSYKEWKDLYSTAATTEGSGEAGTAVEKGADEPLPTLRLVVTESDTLAVGTTFTIAAVDSKETLIGRSRSNNTIAVPEIAVSNIGHAKITFDRPTRLFYICDCGSRNGTFLNDDRLSESRQASDPTPLAINDILQFGSTCLKVDIDDPARPKQQKQQQKRLKSSGEISSDFIPNQRPPQHHLNDAELRKRIHHAKQTKQLYKTLVEQYSDSSGASDKINKFLRQQQYRDRAAERRRKAGGGLLGDVEIDIFDGGGGGGDIDQQTPEFKSSQLETKVSTTNKGYAMLQKLGWKEGSTLGKHGEGIAEPIKVQMRSERAGLGAEAPAAGDNSNKASKPLTKYHQAVMRLYQRNNK